MPLSQQHRKAETVGNPEGDLFASRSQVLSPEGASNESTEIGMNGPAIYIYTIHTHINITIYTQIDRPFNLMLSLSIDCPTVTVSNRIFHVGPEVLRQNQSLGPSSLDPWNASFGALPAKSTGSSATRFKWHTAHRPNPPPSGVVPPLRPAATGFAPVDGRCPALFRGGGRRSTRGVRPVCRWQLTVDRSPTRALQAERKGGRQWQGSEMLTKEVLPFG